jgi:trans-2,3-dihydro-3-hydroxyanthranilate isomerase
MTRLPFATYDVFTDQRYAGNPLAIVESAQGLNTAQMQTIAREFNLSETIFVMPPRDPGHTARVRIFFPTAEIPFAGHLTIGCAIHLACAHHMQGDFETEITLEEEAGLVPVKVIREDGLARACFRAPVIPHPHDGRIDLTLLADALALPAAAIGFDGHRPALFAGGPAFLYVPVADRAALQRARPHEPAWSSMMAQGNVDSAYLYCATQSGYSARMFSPTAGIPEDPATGSAAAILAAQLLDAGQVPDGITSIVLRQGEDMGRPSDMDVTIEAVSGALRAVHVTGGAVPVMQGQLVPPLP